jgi:hypothetical protein
MKKVLSVIAVLIVAFAINTNAQQLGIQGSLGLPMGDFSDIFKAKMGFGATGTYFYDASGKFIITGSIGFLSFSGDDFQIGNTTLSYTWTFIPIYAGARYAFSEGQFAPYAGAEAGYTIINVSVTGGGSATGNSNIALAPMLGFMYEMSKGLNLDVNGKYNIILTSGSSTSYVSVNAGVVFEL